MCDVCDVCDVCVCAMRQPNDDEKKKLLFRQAELQCNGLNDQTGAIETYEALLDVELNPRPWKMVGA